MFCEFLGYDNETKQVLVYGMDMEVLDSFNIGECFIDFMELDLKDFSMYYADISKIIVKSECHNDEEYISSITLSSNEIKKFFTKYPLLRKCVIKKAYDFEAFSKKENTIELSDIDVSLFDGAFNNDKQDIDISDYYDELIKKGCSSDLAFLIYSMDWYIRDSLSDINSFSSLTWDMLYKYNPYIHNQQELINHPYMKLVYDRNSDYDITENMIPHLLQGQYRDAYIFCFDIELNTELNQLSAKERFYLFRELYPDIYFYVNYLESYFMFDRTINTIDVGEHYKNYLDRSASEDFDNNGKFKTLEKNPISFIEWQKNERNGDIAHLIKQVKQLNVEKHQLFLTDKLANITYIEFQKMIEANVKIKKCRNCGKYFLLKGDYATDYCDRILEGETQTCKRIAAIKARKEKVSDNPILQEFQKAYKRNYARLSSKKISQGDFRLWVEEATRKRDLIAGQYKQNPDIQILNTFKQYLGNK